MIYIIIGLSVTTLVLIIGLIVMAIGGKVNQKLSAKLMSLRVVFQALTILLIAAAYFISKK